MSSVELLGVRIRAIGADLPHADARRAADFLETAHSGFTEAMRESVTEVGLSDIATANEHLERALSRMKIAGDHLDEYLDAIGAVRTGTAAPTTAIARLDDSKKSDWWNRRINHISDGDATSEPVDVPLTRLFSELVDLAGRRDRDAYRARLLAAGPATGVKLSGLSWPMIRTLCLDILRRAPRESDDDTLARHVRDTVTGLLPKLPDGVLSGQLRGANSLSAHRRESTEEPHPADAAAVGPAVVSALMKARDTAEKER
ncbi:MAG TPA: hypothetical protein H9881_11590 [Candidatus Stackebrandtia excrementipullorum]|nr:hypothetical protein [Candidatus Stackebrandtia excrementipullorum]